MRRLVLTFRDRSRVELSGDGAAVAELADRIRAAMAGSLDTVISHDLDGQPKHFLCSDIVMFHVEDGMPSGGEEGAGVE